MNPRPAFLWLTEALTVFLNGFIAGLGSGALVGAGTGALAVSPAGDGITPDHKLLAALAGALLSAMGNGLKRVVVWQDTHPLPNPFGEPPPPPPHSLSS